MKIFQEQRSKSWVPASPPKHRRTLEDDVLLLSRLVPTFGLHLLESECEHIESSVKVELATVSACDQETYTEPRYSAA